MQFSNELKFWKIKLPQCSTYLLLDHLENGEGHLEHLQSSEMSTSRECDNIRNHQPHQSIQTEQASLRIPGYSESVGYLF